MSGLFCHKPFPSRYNAELRSYITGQACSSVFVSMSLPSSKVIQDLIVVWRADLLPRWLEEMLERVALDGSSTQDNLSVPWGELQVMDEE